MQVFILIVHKPRSANEREVFKYSKNLDNIKFLIFDKDIVKKIPFEERFKFLKIRILMFLKF